MNKRFKRLIFYTKYCLGLCFRFSIIIDFGDLWEGHYFIHNDRMYLKTTDCHGQEVLSPDDLPTISSLRKPFDVKTIIKIAPVKDLVERISKL